jgi:AcrR family transcriptional regulator
MTSVPASRRRPVGPRKGDLRELAILDAAEELIDTDGVEPVTVEMIARRAGITRGTLYFYFGSKQAVLTALVGRTLDALRDAAGRVADDPTASPRDVVRQAAEATERAWREHGTVMRAAVDLTPTVPEIARLWTATVEEDVRRLTPVLVRAGLPDDDSAGGAAAVAASLCWMTERTFYWASASGTPAALHRATQSCLEVWARVLG